LEACDLHDLGFSGDVFTQRNKQTKGESYIRERLDRAIADVEWRSMFPLVHVKNGDPNHSNHRPVVNDTEYHRPRRRANREDNPFRFEVSWLEEEDCARVVEEAWEGSVGESLSSKLKGVAAGLGDWSINVLGDLQKCVKKAKDLEACRRQLISDDLVQREAALSFKAKRLEEQLDLYWRQRAHVKWLEKGDRNTTFFHHFC